MAAKYGQERVLGEEPSTYHPRSRLAHLLDMMARGVISEEHMRSLMASQGPNEREIERLKKAGGLGKFLLIFFVIF